MDFIETRETKIERLAGDGNIDELKKLLVIGYSQSEIDNGLENAIAYSQTETVKYLLSLGGDISSNNFNGAYYAAHNNELKGLKFAIENGIEINVNNGMLLNEGIITAINTKSVELVEWLLQNGADPKLLTTQSLKSVSDFGSKELKALVKSTGVLKPHILWLRAVGFSIVTHLRRFKYFLLNA